MKGVVSIKSEPPIIRGTQAEAGGALGGDDEEGTVSMVEGMDGMTLEVSLKLGSGAFTSSSK